nr:unnamed protein product [Callosobruchus analis]
MSAALMYMDNTLKHGYLAPYLETLGEKLGVILKIHIGDYLKDFIKTGNFESVGQAISGNELDAIFYGGLNEARINNCQCDYSNIIYFTCHVLLLPSKPPLGSTFQIFDLYCIAFLGTSLLSLIIIWRYYYDISYTQSIDDVFSLLQCSKINTRKYGQVRNNIILGLLIICFMEIAIFYQTGLTTEITKPKLSPKRKYLEDVTDTNLMILNGRHTADHLLPGRSQYVRDHFKRHSLEVDLAIGGKLKYFVNNPNVIANVDSLWLKLIKNPDQIEILYNDPVSMFYIVVNDRDFQTVNRRCTIVPLVMLILIGFINYLLTFQLAFSFCIES